jgi:ferrous iron transport protein A
MTPLVAAAPAATATAAAPQSAGLPRPVTVLPDHVESRVTEIMGDAMLRERLVELGFTPGQMVEVLSRTPGGGPLRVRLRGGAIGLRRDEAACVFVAAPAGS